MAGSGAAGSWRRAGATGVGSAGTEAITGAGGGGFFLKKLNIRFQVTPSRWRERWGSL
jgi:hypothetical protein